MNKNRRIKETSLEDAQLYDQVTQIQTLILDKLYSIRRNSKNYLCQHFVQLKPLPQFYDSTNNYYQKFWKLYLSTQLCREKVRTYNLQVSQYTNQIQKIEANFEKLQQIRSDKKIYKTKPRRKSSDIQKKYECPQQNCYKSYGTYPALRLHLKQKHEINTKAQ